MDLGGSGTFDEILTEALNLQQRDRGVSCRGLKRGSDPSDEYLQVLKAELMKAKRQARRRRESLSLARCRPRKGRAGSISRRQFAYLNDVFGSLGAHLTRGGTRHFGSYPPLVPFLKFGTCLISVALNTAYGPKAIDGRAPSFDVMLKTAPRRVGTQSPDTNMGDEAEPRRLSS